MLSVNTNIGSLEVQNNFTVAQGQFNSALQQLSSGLRINSAADDAAGLAISNGLTSQINGMNQSVRNANDGLSLLGTADSAIQQQTSILQTLRTLAVQASSATNSGTNLKQINTESSQLISELNRIANTTSFNGNNLLDGTFQAKSIQVGSNAGANDQIMISLGSTQANQLGSAYSSTSVSVTANALAAGDVTLAVNGTTYSVGASLSDGLSTVGNTASALAKANAINAITYETGVSATATDTVTAATAQVAGNVLDNDLQINGIDIGAVTIASATDQSMVTAINSKESQTGVTATLNAANKLVLTSVDGRNIEVNAGATGTSKAGFTAGDNTTYGTMTLSSTGAFTIGGANPLTNAGLTAGVAALATTSNVSTVDMSTQTNAQTAIGIITNALSQLNTTEASVGALTNRLNFAINNLNSSVVNATSANSQIKDADFAGATAAMSRASILQQAGIAVMAQANQTPQMALSLLKG